MGTKFLGALVGLVAGLLLASFGAGVQATSYYWIGTSSTSWNSGANWSTAGQPVAGCALTVAGSVPGSGDTVTFDSDCDNSVSIDTNANVAGFTIESGYSGTVTQSGSNTVTVGSSNFSQAGGTFTGGSGTIDINGNFTISGGTFTSTSGTVTISGDFAHSGGTFTHNSGTVTFDGTSQTITGATTFYNLSKTEGVNNSTDESLTFGSSTTFTVTNTLTLDGRDDNDRINLVSNSSGTRFTFDVTGGAASVDFLDVTDSNASSNSITCTSCLNTSNNDDGEAAPRWIFAGSLNISGTVYSDEGSTALGSKTVRLAINGTDNTTATSNASTGAYSFSSISVNSGDVLTLYIEDESQDAVTVTVIGGSDLTGINIFQDRLIARCDNSCSLTNSNLSTAAVASETDISNIYSVSSGNLTAAAGKELFIPSSHTFVPGGTVTADDIDINGTLTLSSNAASISGIWDATGGSFTTSGTVTFTSTGSEDIISNSNSFQNLTLNGSGGTFEIEDALDINGNLTISAGTLDVKSGENNAMTLAGNWDNSGSFTERSGTVTFDGTGAQTLTGETFYNLTINNSAGSPADSTDVDSSAVVTVSNTLTVTDGQFQPTTASDFSAVTISTNGILKPDSGATITVSGAWNNTGTFTHNSGTVTFDGVSQALNDDNTFYNLTKSVSAADTLTLESAATQTVTNVLTFQGANELLLSLRSSSSGTQWRINPQVTRTVRYIDVKDSNNVNTSAITCTTGCVNSLNNTNWDFGATSGPAEPGGGGGGGGSEEPVSTPTPTPKPKPKSTPKPTASPIHPLSRVVPPPTCCAVVGRPGPVVEEPHENQDEESREPPALTSAVPSFPPPPAPVGPPQPRSILASVARALPTGPAVTTAISATAALALAASSGIVSALPTAVANTWHLFQRVGHGILGLIATRRRFPWGRVIDAHSRQALPQVIVRILDRQTQRVRDTAVTDAKGEFASLLSPGQYRLEAIKPGWHLEPGSGQWYDGNVVEVTQEGLVSVIIAMRPAVEVEASRLVLQAVLQRLEQILTALSWPLLAIGFVLSLAALAQQRSWLNVTIVGIYVFLMAAKFWIQQSRQETLGHVRDAATGSALTSALVQLYDASTGRLMSTKITTTQGQFALLPAPGVYTVIVSKAGYHTYRESHVVVSPERQKALAMTFGLTPETAQPMVVEGLTPTP